MNIQRFTAPTSREALAKARLAFGEGTLILSNRPTASGVEVMATGEDTLEALDRQAEAQQQAKEHRGCSITTSTRIKTASTPNARRGASRIHQGTRKVRRDQRNGKLSAA